MSKPVLLGASWCPVTKETQELFEEVRKESPDFDYDYIDIESKKGKRLVNKFSVASIPKIIFQDRILFHGLPTKEELLEIMENKNLKSRIKK